MKIAIIDSGVNLQFRDFSEHSIECREVEDSVDKNGHGTACCGECLLVDKDCQILMLKILDEHARGSLLKLAEVLDYCYTRDDIKIISISMSAIVNDGEIIAYFQEIVDKLYFKGVTIIASNENGKNKGFPASLRHVLSVKYKKSRGTHELFFYINDKGIYYGKVRLMPWLDGKYKFFSGNSSAVPRVAALLTKRMNEKHNLLYSVNCGIYVFKEERKKLLEKTVVKGLLSEYYKIWKKSGGWKTEEDCMRAIQFIEERGKINMDPKVFSTSDFMHYNTFAKKCLYYLGRRK